MTVKKKADLPRDVILTTGNKATIYVCWTTDCR